MAKVLIGVIVVAFIVIIGFLVIDPTTTELSPKSLIIVVASTQLRVKSTRLAPTFSVMASQWAI